MKFNGTKAETGTEPVTLQPRIRTLVVDDSPFMLKSLAQILNQAANFDLVGTATNGCQALRQASAVSPDLVLMDIHLSGLNGLQVAQYIKQREHPPAVVIISSDTRPVTKVMAERAGADGFLSKRGDLQHRLLGVLEDLFGPSGASRTGARDSSFRNQPPYKKRPRESASGKLQMWLKIQFWPPTRFRPAILIEPRRLCGHDFRESHNDHRHSSHARSRSRTTAHRASPLRRANGSATVRFPGDLARAGSEKHNIIRQETGNELRFLLRERVTLEWSLA